MISVIGIHRNLANIFLKTNPGGFLPTFTSWTVRLSGTVY